MWKTDIVRVVICQADILDELLTEFTVLIGQRIYTIL